MKNSFTKPEVEVVRFGDNDIILTSCPGNCDCNVAGVQFDSNEACTGANTPQCDCELDTQINCV